VLNSVVPPTIDANADDGKVHVDRKRQTGCSSATKPRPSPRASAA
jgi:hypothetical protein